MSSPIAIRRSSVSSSGSAWSAFPASLVRALYVPVHKRSASSASSATAPSSPSHCQPESPIVNTSSTVHPHVYSMGFLLSLRPFAVVDIREKVLTACPEAVINCRVRQRVEHTIRTTTKPTAATTTATTTPPTKTTMQRVTPCHTHFGGRAPERRRQALNLHSDSWCGLRDASTPLPLISV